MLTSNTSPTDFKLQFLNCNSISNKLSEIKIALLQTSPSIVCLSETWLNQRFLPKFPSYSTLWKHRPHRMGGGLGFLIHKEIQYQEINLNPMQGGELEVQAVSLHMRNHPPLSLLNLYNPQRNISEQEFHHYISQLGDYFILVGDFNAHTPLLNSTQLRCNPTGSALESLIVNSAVCLINPVDMHTYIDRRTGNPSCLDLCLSSPNIASSLDISPLLDVGSDHLLIEIKINLQPTRYTWQTLPRFRVNSDKLKHFTSTYLPPSTHYPLSTDALEEDLTCRLTETASKCFGTPTARSTTARRTPWWSFECHQAVQNRRRALKKFQHHPTMQNFIQYKRTSAESRYVIKTRKRESLQEFIGSLDHQTPQSIIWKKLKAFQSTYSPPNFPLEDNGTLILDPICKANHLNDYFSSMGGPVPHTEPYHDVINSSYSEEGGDLNSLITESELFHCLQRLKNSSPGPDKITNNMIKSAHPDFLLELLNLYNQSFQLGICPTPWKHGIISPIPKPQKPAKHKTGFRPITLLPCLGKLLERILKTRLEYHLETNNLLNPVQTGFRPKKGATNVILKLTNQIRLATSTTQCCLTVYIDLKGAFDSVWRHALLFKLALLGVKGHFLRWISSYLAERPNAVNVHGYLSRELVSLRGVPQGGVLSPLLFNVMLQDIPTSANIETYLFADDNTLACSGPTPEYV